MDVHRRRKTRVSFGNEVDLEDKPEGDDIPGFYAKSLQESDFS